jgi:hypothetical protein
MIDERLKGGIAFLKLQLPSVEPSGTTQVRKGAQQGVPLVEHCVHKNTLMCINKQMCISYNK